MAYRDDFFYTERKNKFGFATNAAKRDLLYGNILQQAAASAGKYVHDKTLAGEILGLTVKNNRIDHAASGHDDHVMSWLLCHWFTRMAMNLHHYGIPAGLALSGLVDQSEEKKSVTDRWKEEQQRAYLQEIDQLILAISDCENEALVALYERKLHMLSRKIEATGEVKNFSVDEVMERARRERDKKLRLTQSLGTGDPESQVREQLLETIAQHQRGLYRGYSSFRG